MSCHMARELMLTAEPSELDGSGVSELSRHLAACEPCRSAATALAAAHRHLSQTLLVATTDSARAARTALQTAEQRRVRARAVRWVAPLAVAAGLAIVLINRASPPTGPVAPLQRPEPVSQRVSVTAPRGRSVAVLQAEHSNVVVIWFY